jgi:hypothetical protein
VAEVFGELAENVAVDLRPRLGRVNRQMNLLGGHPRNSKSERCETKTNQKCAQHGQTPLDKELEIHGQDNEGKRRVA